MSGLCIAPVLAKTLALVQLLKFQHIYKILFYCYAPLRLNAARKYFVYSKLLPYIYASFGRNCTIAVFSMTHWAPLGNALKLSNWKKTILNEKNSQVAALHSNCYCFLPIIRLNEFKISSSSLQLIRPTFSPDFLRYSSFIAAHKL